MIVFSPLVEQFRNDDHFGKMRMISESVLGKRPASDEDIQNLLLVAMKDPDSGNDLRHHEGRACSGVTSVRPSPSPPTHAERDADPYLRFPAHPKLRRDEEPGPQGNPRAEAARDRAFSRRKRARADLGRLA